MGLFQLALWWDMNLMALTLRMDMIPLLGYDRGRLAFCLPFTSKKFFEPIGLFVIYFVQLAQRREHEFRIAFALFIRHIWLRHFPDD